MPPISSDVMVDTKVRPPTVREMYGDRANLIVDALGCQSQGLTATAVNADANLAIESDPVKVRPIQMSWYAWASSNRQDFRERGTPSPKIVTGVRRSPIGRGQADHNSVDETSTTKLGVKRSWHQ